MEIKKRLRVQGSNEVNAVLLSDEGEEYPVFLESLHNTIKEFDLLRRKGRRGTLYLTDVKDGFFSNGPFLDAKIYTIGSSI